MSAADSPVPSWAKPCLRDDDDSSCTSWGTGHVMHWIQAKRAGTRAPWGWRDAVVAGFEDGCVRLTYVHDDGAPLVWSHLDLTTRLDLGQPLRLHEGAWVLDVGVTWLSVAIKGGLGPVPEPSHPELWEAETTTPIVNLATGEVLLPDPPADNS